MKCINGNYSNFFGARLHFSIALVFICISPNIYSQNLRPFWDKWDSGVEMILPPSQLEVCATKSTFIFTAIQPAIDCKPLERADFPRILSELILIGDELKEMKILILKADRSSVYIRARLEGKMYQLLSILFNKNLGSYFLELKDSENKYYIFLLDPAKISFPVE
ncbi:MAG: hypothetical protein IT569_09730 [Leptospiraceae bacterium]|nr:hypothetical protein [Leptospiraceae bacterium]